MTTNTATHIDIRWMNLRDLPEVVAIEGTCFDARRVWSQDDFLGVLRNSNVVGMVADRDGLTVGFMLYELHRDRLHILNFAVHSRQQRTGVGRAMANKLKSKLGSKRARLTALVSDSNLHAHRFFKAMGFVATEVVRGYYGQWSDDDAYWFEFSK